MLNFNEDLLQFIWKNKLLLPIPLVTVSGKPIQIIKHGESNSDAGPDFFNAIIKIDDIQLAGNIELHLRSSDWLKHGHLTDKRYDTIILHVVYEHDVELKQNTRHNVEVLEIKNYVSTQILTQYTELYTNQNKLPCSKQLNQVNDLKFIMWLERMQMERLESRVERISEIFETSGHNYSQTFYTLMLRSFGAKVNAMPFELLATHLPLNLVLKHVDSLTQIEALLLGTAGLLNDQYKSSYVKLLQNEYEFLKQKYKLVPLSKEIFKHSRMRPANFPDHKLMQLAAFIKEQTDLFLNPTHYKNSQELKSKFNFNLSEYGAMHYKLDGLATQAHLKLGTASVENAIINAVAPFYFFYAKRSGQQEYISHALNLLDNCSFEDNTKTKLFQTKKQLFKTAGNSQALLHLYDNYCSHKKCLNCGIALAILYHTGK